MRALVGICLLAAGVAMPGSASAQETEALRKELEEMRKQFETMKEGYEKAINQMSERLKALESRSAPAPAAPATAAPAPATPPAAPATPATPAPPPAVAAREQAPSQGGVTINPAELARPREPFALYERRGAGQLLFDMGVTGDFIGNLTQRNVDKANAGTFSGRENRFFPREVEVSLFGQIDPYARAEVRFEAGEEDQGEITTHLAEANLTLMTLPFNTQLKMGQMRNRFGLLNPIHEHDRPFIDQPNVLTRFLGDEGLVERGAELTWVAPLPFFLEALVGFDAKYKYKPDGWQHPLLTLLGEMIYQTRRVNVLGEDINGDGIPDTPNETRLRNRWGWYAGGEIQPFRVGQLARWAAGFRYDWTEFPIMRGHEWAVGPYLAFMPSEFLRFRLGYKYTQRDKRDGFSDNDSTARKVDEILFQATFILGAHPAHPF